MITNLLVHLTGFITHTIDVLGYGGVVLLMGIESAAIPLPSEIIMPFAGFLVDSGRFSLLGLAIAGGIGSVLGSMFTYFLGFYGGRRLILNYGHYVLLSENELNLAEKFFKKFGGFSLLFGRVIPIVRTFISIPAGIAKANFLNFTITAFVGSVVWSYFLAWIGRKLGEHWKDLEIYFRKFDILILAAILILIGFWLYRHFKTAQRPG